MGIQVVMLVVFGEQQIILKEKIRGRAIVEKKIVVNKGLAMRIYLAGRFSRRHILQELAENLEAQGHTIVSRWTQRGAHKMPPGPSEQAQDEERERFAIEDIEDLHACDCVISLMEEPRSGGRGGRHIEFGYALALGKRMMIVGPKETVFHHLLQVESFDSTEALLVQLRREMMTDECNHVWVANSGQGGEPEFRPNRQLSPEPLTKARCNRCGARTWFTRRQWESLKEERQDG